MTLTVKTEERNFIYTDVKEFTVSEGPVNTTQVVIQLNDNPDNEYNYYWNGRTIDLFTNVRSVKFE